MTTTIQPPEGATPEYMAWVERVTGRSLPVLITNPGQYVTRSGEVVTVDDVSDHHWKRGRYPSRVHERWHRSGRLLSGTETANDIVGPSNPTK